MTSSPRHSRIAAATAGTLLLASSSAFAAAQFVITETYVGISGEDGTVDWIEVTNLGDRVGSTAGLYYDDESLDASDAGALDDFTLAPGESAVFLIDDEAADDDTFGNSLEEFTAIWGDGIRVGLTNGGGGLSQNGDTAAIGTVISGAIFDLVSSLSYSGDDLIGDGLHSLEQVLGLPVAASELGVHGAFESSAFFNDNLGLPGDSATLVGSPGVAPVPVPAMLPVLALALFGLGVGTRRR